MNNKKHYRMGEVSTELSLPSPTIRFWEKSFPELKPSRSSGGHRYYTQKQLNLLKYIKKLLYDEGYTIEGANKRITDEKSKTPIQTESSCQSSAAMPSDNLIQTLKNELNEILAILNAK
jgi:DNA-binding transcriptional MerR regulator